MVRFIDPRRILFKHTVVVVDPPETICLHPGRSKITVQVGYPRLWITLNDTLAALITEQDIIYLFLCTEFMHEFNTQISGFAHALRALRRCLQFVNEAGF